MDSSIVACLPDAVGCITENVDSGTIEPLSAIGAFSNLISSLSDEPKYDPMPTLRIPRTVSSQAERSLGFHSLPTEIIQMIFHCIFESYIGLKDSGDINANCTALWLDEDLLSPSLFPYALASVCLRWFRILRTIPIYWTRIVVTLEDVAASLHTARTLLAWAGSHPFKIVVMRHYRGFQNRDSERAAIGHTMEWLRPHIDRIWSLSFDLEYSSSIPALWRECGHAQLLKALTLRSRSDADDIPQSSTLLHDEDYKGIYSTPLLREVALSGHLLKNPMVADLRHKDWFKHTTSLTVCGDTATPGRACMYRFLSVITSFDSIEKLMVQNIHFDDCAPSPNMYMLKPAALCLRRVAGRTALLDILTRTRMGTTTWQDIAINDCVLHHSRGPDLDPDAHFSSTHLTLASMDPSAAGDFVRRWNGKWLSVLNCPKLSRAFMEGLHGEAMPVGLSYLWIVDCDGFSAGDVIALVQSRERQAARGSLMSVADDDDSFKALVELSVQGRGPPINLKRATWLAEHVETFSWDTVARDGVRYAWNGSAGRLVMVRASGS